MAVVDREIRSPPRGLNQPLSRHTERTFLLD